MSDQFKQNWKSIQTIYDFQNQELEKLFKVKKVPEIKSKLQEYMAFNDNEHYFGTITGSLEGDFRQRWHYWIEKIIQVNWMELFIEIIPQGRTLSSYKDS